MPAPDPLNLEDTTRDLRDKVNQIKDAPSAEPPPLPDFGAIPPHPDRQEAAAGKYGKLSQAETRESIRLWSVGMNFVASVGGGAAIGYLVDRWQGSTPWGILIGTGIGMAVGFWSLMREALRDPSKPKKPPGT